MYVCKKGFFMKTKVTISIEEETKEKAKIIAAKTKLNVSEIIDYLIQDLSEKDILKLSEKK